MHDDHPHPHDHRPDQDDPLSDYQLMEIAVRELLIEKRILTADEIRGDTALLKEEFDLARRFVNTLLDVEHPIIARINGDAIGLGATLALLCDISIAATDARIGDPHVRVGLVAGDGGAVAWPLLIGYARAKQYLLGGDLLSAAEAQQIGLVNFSVPPAELERVVRKR